jgi:hypothetical protein
LYAAGYEGLTFHRRGGLADSLSSHFRDLCEPRLTSAALISAMAARVSGDAVAGQTGEAQISSCAMGNATTHSTGGRRGVTGGVKVRAHVPLFSRATEPSIEARMQRAGITELGQTSKERFLPLADAAPQAVAAGGSQR